ncbi:DNA polymerase III subunit delta' [Hirschia litorea]|uniref:DNA polymerase III subunit delta n=1 Tax=Hirschia litorea TaxID=1199156 RepID=A0ABW2II57_9PROT
MNDDINRSFGPVYGHEEVQNELIYALKSGRMHHGWMFTGPRGVGKYRLALQFAASLLSGLTDKLDLETDDHTSHLILNSSHPDLRTVQRPFDDKGKQKSEIPVSSIRDLIKFFSLRPAMGGWRIAIIDSLDEMNRNGENALLKTLEEPPPMSLIILVVHGETPILPTIKSRCRTLRFGSLEEEKALLALQKAGLKEVDARDALSFAPGRPGKAMLLRSTEARSAARAAKSAALHPRSLDFRDLSEVLSNASKTPESFDAAFNSLCLVAYNAAKNADNPIKAGAWAETHESLVQLSAETKNLNQDKSQAVANAIMQLQRTGRIVGR